MYIIMIVIVMHVGSLTVNAIVLLANLHYE